VGEDADARGVEGASLMRSFLKREGRTFANAGELEIGRMGGGAGEKGRKKNEKSREGGSCEFGGKVSSKNIASGPENYEESKLSGREGLD